MVFEIFSFRILLINILSVICSRLLKNNKTSKRFRTAINKGTTFPITLIKTTLYLKFYDKLYYLV